MLMWIEHHGFEFFLIYYAFTAFSGGMPTPADTSGAGYRWLFSSLQILNGSLARLPLRIWSELNSHLYPAPEVSAGVGIPPENAVKA
jgi:hypothetical protein